MSDQNSINVYELSVVIALQNAHSKITQCLLAIEKQCSAYVYEIIVVDNTDEKITKLINQQFPNVKLIKAAKEKLIPELWAIGISASSGEIISLTTTDFIPANDWIVEIIKAHNSPYAGIGGAIENKRENSLVSWAIYFCRYNRYMLPFQKTNVTDFAADNASYKRTALMSIKSETNDGFWEHFVHQKMCKEDMKLCLTPEILVFHQNSITFSDFIVQRFRHGQRFGKTRSNNLFVTKRIALLFFAPVIPFLYLRRITRQVLIRKTNIMKYILSLPILFIFLVSWAAGETLGYFTEINKSCHDCD